MPLTFRTLAMAVAALGILIGVSFGTGVAYGRNDPKTVQSGLTAQQIQSLLGISSAPASGGTAQGSTGGQRPGAGGTVTGRVAAVDGQSITVETRQGDQKVTLGPNTTLTKLATGASSDFREGQSVLVTGSRKEDGSVEATSLLQLTPELQAMLAGAGAINAGGAGSGR